MGVILSSSAHEVRGSVGVVVQDMVNIVSREGLCLLTNLGWKWSRKGDSGGAVGEVICACEYGGL